MRVSLVHTSMAEVDGLVNAVDELLDSPGGAMLASFRSYLRKRVKMLAVVFALGFMVTFPLTKSFIAWLIDPSRLPANVEIIVITPVEFIPVESIPVECTPLESIPLEFTPLEIIPLESIPIAPSLLHHAS